MLCCPAEVAGIAPSLGPDPDLPLLSPCCSLRLRPASAPQLQAVMRSQVSLLQCLHGATWTLLRPDLLRERPGLRGHLLPPAQPPASEVQRIQALLAAAWASQVLLRCALPACSRACWISPNCVTVCCHPLRITHSLARFPCVGIACSPGHTHTSPSRRSCAGGEAGEGCWRARTRTRPPKEDAASWR
jgi:hypothetical protein